MVMEDQAMSSSNTCTPKPEKLKGILVAMEESKEKATKDIHLKLGSPQVVIPESRIENPSFGYGTFLRGREIMKFYPSEPNKIHTCKYCKKGFQSSKALGGHQKAHRKEREWEKKRKEMEKNFPGLAFLNSLYLDKPHILLGGHSQDALSNENHLGFTLDPFKSAAHPSFNNGVIGGIAEMNMTAVPGATPTRFFTGNTSTNGSTSRVPDLLPSKNYMSPYQNAPISTDFSLQENDFMEEDFISKIGIKNDMEIEDADDDDDDQPEEGTSESGGVNLSLSL